MKINRILSKLSKLAIIALFAISLFGCSNGDIKNESKDFRTLSIVSYTGVITIKRASGEEIQAYEGMSLDDNDEVIVGENSTLVIQLDNDKKLYAEPGTRFKLQASGSQGDSKTKIVLEEGCVLSRLDKQLNDSEYFEVETNSASMSVKGTVFRVEIIKNSDDTIFNLIEVFDGKVYTSTIDGNDNTTLGAGQASLIKTGSQPIFVSENLINQEAWEKVDGDILLLDKAPNGNPLLSIPYEKLPKETIDILISILDDNRKLTVKKETLELMKDEVEHQYMTKSYVEPTCEKEGKKVLECQHCHIQKVITIDKLEHEYVTDRAIEPTCESKGLTEGYHCDKCGTVFVAQEIIPALGHNGDPCERCGYSYQEALRAGKTTNKSYQSITITPNITKAPAKLNNTIGTELLTVIVIVLSAVIFLVVKYLVK